MRRNTNRREFMKQSLLTGTGVALCCCFGCEKSTDKEMTSNAEELSKKIGEDINQLSYCGINCNEKCELFRATKNNDLQLKAKVAKEWFNKAEDEFKPEEIFCYGCKTENKPQNQLVANCAVRKCAREKMLAICAQCNAFPTCDKELWTKWPTLKQRIEEIRSKLEAQGLRKNNLLFFVHNYNTFTSSVTF